MSSTEEYLAALAAAWQAERQATVQRFADERAGRSLAQRVAAGIALDALTIADERGAPRGRARVLVEAPPTIDLDSVRMGPGEPITLRDRGEGGLRLRGVLERREGQGLWLLLDDFPEPTARDRKLILEPEAPETTFERGTRALTRLAGAVATSDLGRLRAVLTLARAPATQPPSTWQPFDRQLDERQRAAVALGLDTLDLALVHGPPGTGKTRTLLEIVRQRVARGERLLCVAPSNAAVDHLGALLAELGLRVVRLGHPARIAPALAELSLDAQVEADGATALARQWRDRARALRKSASGKGGRQAWAEARQLDRDAAAELANVERALTERAQVVLATCVGADHPVLGERTFDCVVIDEATQAPDPIALIAACRGRQLVLAGDPQQLGPVVISPHEREQRLLGSTLFARLAAAHGEGATVMLEQQHRMHEAIMTFASRTMYGGKLRAHPAVAGHTLAELGIAEDPLRAAPLVVIDSAGKDWSERRDDREDGEDRADPSTANPGHAERVAAEVRRLLSRGLPATELAVIAAYDAQVRLLRRLLVPERAAGLAVGTVDGFQGQEREAVIVDLVRSNDRGEIGFLSDLRRSNVALTRARRLLLVVADSATLGGHAYYGELLRHAEALGGHVSAWADEAEPL